MSRGFGATYGTGASYAIVTGVTSSGSDRRSYSMWFLRNGAGGGNFGHFFVKNFSEEFFWGNSSSTFIYARCNAGGTQTSRYRLGSGGTSAGTANVWNHVLLTHDQSSGALTFPVAYWNGVVNNTVALVANGVTASNSNPYLLGNDHVNTRVWDGLLAHFAIWDDIILGEAEARALTSGVHPMSIAGANCVCYLPLDGIHSPETDFVFANTPAVITGAKFGVLMPDRVSMYIPPFRNDNMSLLQAIAAAPTIGPMVSLLY